MENKLKRKIEFTICNSNKKPSIETIYLFSVAEQEVLKVFICKNLNTKFI